MDEDQLTRLLEEVEERRARGETVDLETYRAQLGEDFAEFQAVLRLEESFDSAMDPSFDAGLPRAFGDYILAKERGHGAVGVVYEAYQPKLDRRVALKLLRPEFEADPRFRQRYEREAKSCAQVRHRNLVEIYDYGEIEGRLYYAMPLLRGQSLSAWARGEGSIDPRAAAAQFAGIAEALAAMHAARLIHRDVKPANILVEDDGTFVLADFGLARNVDMAMFTQTGENVGTPLYMSPEQLIGRPSDMDHRTDIYALGATMYEVFAGRRAFDATSLEALHHQVLQVAPEPLEALARDLPEGLARVVMTCLEKRPEDRYVSAAALAADLRAVASGGVVQARPVPAWRRWVRRVGRPPLAAAALVLAALGLFVLFQGDGRKRAGAPTARIVVTTLPSGEIAVGDAEFRLAPRSLDLPPGRVRLRMRAAGCREREDAFTIEAGTEYSREYVLALRSGTDREAVERFIAATGLPYVPVSEAALRRTSTAHGSALLWPRGRMHAEGLDTLRIDITASHPGPGRVVFGRGADVLATLPFAAETYVTEMALPPAVRAAAQDGKPVTWRLEAQGTVVARATFHVTATGLDASFARIERLCSDAAVPQPAGTRALLRAHAWLAKGFGVAAYRELSALRDPEDLARDSVMAVRLQLQALQRAYGDDIEQRDGTPAWRGLLLRLEDLETQAGNDGK